MKLYNKESVAEPKLSLEEFHNQYSSLAVISQESISGFFAGVQDVLSTGASRLLSLNNDKITTDALSSRFETIHAVKKLKMGSVANAAVQIPENFSGKYLDYAGVLNSSSRDAVASCDKVLDSLKMSISSFINEYSEDKLFTIYGKSIYSKATAETEARRKLVSNFFPKARSIVKAQLKDVLRNLNEVPDIFTLVKKTDEEINEDILKKIIRKSKECSELVDALIEHNTKSGVMLRNEDAKKELVEAIYVSAKEVEFIGYLYSNVIFFNTAVKRLSETLISEEGKLGS